MRAGRISKWMEGRRMKNRIKEALEFNRMSQHDLAERIGVTETSISRYVNGSRAPKAPVAIRIAKALGTTVEYLFSEEMR